MSGEHDPAEPVRLTSTRTEFEAATIAAALREHGIDARPVGVMTAGFKAEAPGEVQVMVRRGDLDRARLALRAIHAESVDLPWDQVPIGAPEGDGPAGDGVSAGRRWAWTLVIVIVIPLGLFLTLITARRPVDIAVRAIGPSVLLVGVILAVWLWVSGSEEGEGGEGS